MMKSTLATLTLCLFVLSAFGQNRILITEQEIKLKGKESKSIHYACAQGDRITIEMSEAKGKPIGQVEVIDYPNWVRHSELSPVEYNREFTVSTNGFQEFRISGKTGGRICTVRIYRTPSSPETLDFNTRVVWIEKVDTTWHDRSKQVVIGYEPRTVTRSKWELIKVDTSLVGLSSKNIVVKAGSTDYEQFLLPVGVKPNAFRPEYSKEVISWSYWIGVGQNSKDDYERQKNALASTLKLGGALLANPILGQLAATGVSLIPTRTGDDYTVYNVKSTLYPSLDNGRVSVATKRIDNPREGWITFSFANENNSLFGSSITVSLEAVALVIEKRWGEVKYDEQISSPIHKTEYYKEAEVIRTQVPTFAK